MVSNFHGVRLIGEDVQIGAGIQILPNASKHLLKGGLGEFLNELHEEAPCYIFRCWKNGTIIGRMKTETHLEHFGGPYVHIHRADLQQALLKVAL